MKQQLTRHSDPDTSMRDAMPSNSGQEGGFFNARLYLSARDITEMFGVCTKTAQNWMLSARVDANAKMLKVGKARRIEKAGFMSWLEGMAV